MFTTDELFKKVMLIFNKQPELKVVTRLDICCFELSDAKILQETLFETGEERKREVSKALDKLNDRYGEYTVIPALMLERQNEVIDRIAFGGVKDLADLYKG